MFNIVLVEPEIPQNTGNISRTCAATHSVLHLVKPLGFEISDRTLKRAGLDYWQYLDVRYYENTLRIPMWQNLRSLNLSNSVALTLYEALRQTGFEGLNPEGHLTGRPD